MSARFVNKNPDEVYIAKWYDKVVPAREKIPPRCGNDLCRCIIPIGASFVFGNNKKKYCSDWCREQATIDKIKIHQCKGCGYTVEPFPRKNGGYNSNSSGVYPNYCDKCKEKGYHLLRGKARIAFLSKICYNTDI